MQAFNWLYAGLLGFVSCYADNHNPSLGINFDPFGDKQAQVKLTHESAIDVGSDVFLFSTYFQSNQEFSHYLGSGFGYRFDLDRFSIGPNFHWKSTNKPGFFVHQFCPGFEILFDHFQISFNEYVPMKDKKRVGKISYLFDQISEFSVTYRPQPKYEFEVAPFINHRNKKIGVRGSASAFIYDNWQIAVQPHFDFEQKSCAFSLTYHFGGAKRADQQSMRKSEKFYYAGLKIVKPEVPKIVPQVPSPIIQPVFQKPVLEPEKELIPEIEEEEEPVTEPNEPEPPQPKKWGDFFFGPSKTVAKPT